jgi:ubiquinone/menaquinone biosynthesis C-methylase UbiE
MSTKKEEISRWERAYKEGAHWEEGPSKNMQKFTKYLKKGDKILDIGCGSGRDSIFLAKQGFEVWGIDISKEAIKKAKEKFRAKNLHFLVGDIKDLKFKDEFFDAVYSGWVLQSIPLKKASLEIFRVLKKGGVAFLAFLLNTKIIATGKITEFHKKEDIISTYKNFQILKQLTFKSEDFKAKEPHTHDAFIIILKK